MPVGINVEDDPKNDGFVLIEFVNSALKGPALKALIDDGGPDIVQKLSREKGAERVRYRVPEGNAVAAGLIVGSGVDLDNVTQFGGTDPTGIVLPTVPITHANIHAPVIRRGTYKDGYGENQVETQPSEPVNPAIAAPTQAEVAEYVHDAERSLKEREGRDPDNDGILGFAGIQPLMTPIAPSSADQEPPAVSPDLSPFGAQASAQTPETPAPELTQVSLQQVAENDEQRGYPEGEPTMEWTRPQIDAYAAKVKNVDTTRERSKGDALALLNPPT